MVAQQASPFLEIPCATPLEGEAVLARIRALDIPLQSLELRTATLEESFRQFGLYASDAEREVNAD